MVSRELIKWKMKIFQQCYFSHEGMIWANFKFCIPELTYGAVSRKEVTAFGDMFMCQIVIIIL